MNGLRWYLSRPETPEEGSRRERADEEARDAAEAGTARPAEVLNPARTEDRCRYRDCPREPRPGWTTCARHYSAGRSRAQDRMARARVPADAPPSPAAEETVRRLERDLFAPASAGRDWAEGRLPGQARSGTEAARRALEEAGGTVRDLPDWLGETEAGSPETDAGRCRRCLLPYAPDRKENWGRPGRPSAIPGLCGGCAAAELTPGSRLALAGEREALVLSVLLRYRGTYPELGASAPPLRPLRLLPPAVDALERLRASSVRAGIRDLYARGAVRPAERGTWRVVPAAVLLLRARELTRRMVGVPEPEPALTDGRASVRFRGVPGGTRPYLLSALKTSGLRAYADLGSVYARLEQDCPECGGALEPGGTGHAAECPLRAPVAPR